jgi:hypothetical protein
MGVGVMCEVQEGTPTLWRIVNTVHDASARCSPEKTCATETSAGELGHSSDLTRSVICRETKLSCQGLRQVNDSSPVFLP